MAKDSHEKTASSGGLAIAHSSSRMRPHRYTISRKCKSYSRWQNAFSKDSLSNAKVEFRLFKSSFSNFSVSFDVCSASSICLYVVFRD